MPTKKASATVTVDRETLFDVVACFEAANDLLTVLAGNDTDHPVSRFFEFRIDTTDKWLGAGDGEGEVEYFDDPVRVEIRKAAAAICSEMLKAILADPYDELVSQKHGLTRPRLHDHQLGFDAVARGGGKEWQDFFLRRRAEPQRSAEETEVFKRIEEKLTEVADQATRLSRQVTEMVGVDA